MAGEHVNQATSGALHQAVASSGPKRSKAGEGEFDLGTMSHDNDYDCLLRDPELWDPELFPDDIHSIVEDFYGQSGQTGDETESFNPPNSSIQGESMDCRADGTLEDGIESFGLESFPGPSVSRVPNIPGQGRPQVIPPEMLNEFQSELGHPSQQESSAAPISEAFQHSYLYSQNTWSQPESIEANENTIEVANQGGSLDQEPAHASSWSTPSTFPAALASQINNDGEHQDSDEAQLPNLNAAYPDLHLGQPRDYFYPIPELKVLLCTACHQMCPDRQLYIDHHLIICHNLPRIRHIITGCMSILPNHGHRDLNMCEMEKRIKNEIQRTRPDIARIPFLGVELGYACPVATCCHVHYDSTKILLHSRTVHNLSTRRRGMVRVPVHNLHVNRARKISITVRQSDLESPLALFTTVGDLPANST